MTTADRANRSQSSRERIPSSRRRGGRLSTSSSPGSKAMATSWNPSITMFSHRIWAGSNKGGQRSTSDASSASTAARPADNR